MRNLANIHISISKGLWISLFNQSKLKASSLSLPRSHNQVQINIFLRVHFHRNLNIHRISIVSLLIESPRTLLGSKEMKLLKVSPPLSQETNENQILIYKKRLQFQTQISINWCGIYVSSNTLVESGNTSALATKIIIKKK